MLDDIISVWYVLFNVETVHSTVGRSETLSLSMVYELDCIIARTFSNHCVRLPTLPLSHYFKSRSIALQCRQGRYEKNFTLNSLLNEVLYAFTEIKQVHIYDCTSYTCVVFKLVDLNSGHTRFRCRHNP